MIRLPRFHTQHSGIYAILGACVAIFFTVVLYIPSFIGDFFLHQKYALYIQENGYFVGVIPHALYHLVFVFFDVLLPWLSIRIISILPVILANVLLSWVIFTVIWQETRAGISKMMVAILSFSLLIITPIFLQLNLPFLLGYINPVVYHNPTQHMLRLFVIPASLFALRVIQFRRYRSFREQIRIICISAIVIILMGFSKPSYTICLVPTMGVLVSYNFLTKKKIDWLLLIFGIVIPITILLIPQFVGTFLASDTGGIGFGFLTYLRERSLSDWQILSRFMLSVLLPAIVYILYFSEARQDTYLNFCWVSFGFGCMYFYFFYETGYRLGDGNFGWSAYIALFLLMFATMLFVAKKYQEATEDISGTWRETYTQIPWRLKVIGFVFLLHMLSAIRYYLVYLTLTPDIIS